MMRQSGRASTLAREAFPRIPADRSPATGPAGGARRAATRWMAAPGGTATG